MSISRTGLHRPASPGPLILALDVFIQEIHFLHLMVTVNVDIFAQYIFLRISRRAVDARKYDVSENMKYYSANRINC